MGLSSSQARLLSLTGRMHDIEYKAQKLEAQKLQMANESAHVYQEYENALNATKIQFKQISTDGSSTFIDATYNAMKKAGYTLKFEDDYKPIISATTKEHYVAAGNSKEYFIALENGRITTDNRTVNGVTEIYTATQLQSMTSSGNYRLMADIDLSGLTWTSKSFSGTLDGNGHSITGLDKALFTSLSGATVQNLSIQGTTSTSNGLLANSIVGKSTVSNVAIKGNIYTSSDNIGGLAGKVSGSEIIIQNCSADVNITSQGSNVGGLIGSVDSVKTISNCTTSGVITAYSIGGGLIGKMNIGNVTNCISNADVNSTLCNVYNSSNKSYNNDACTGGFIGILNGGTISNCEATGDVTAEGLVVGGFIGYLMSGTIKESTARGDVTGNINSNIIKIKNEYMANTAGFVSAVCGVIENCDAYGNVSFGEIEGATIIPPTSFASSNMSGVSGKGEINNCYAATTSDDTLFINNKHNLASEPTVSDTPNNSPASVTPPTIQVNETINDTVDAGKVFDEIKKYGYILEGSNNDPVGNNGDNSTWFTNMVNAGLLFIFKNDTQGNEYQVNVATDTNLQEVSSDLELKKAEAKYEADMRKINAKDKKFDTDIAALETERNAIKTEMDTLKSVAKDNVDRTFKLFS